VDALVELTVDEVAARLGQPGFRVYDCNGPARWKRSHVPGAVNLDADTFGVPELGAAPGDALVFYCSGPG
jgi:rhodanese-related sulfurtransferase